MRKTYSCRAVGVPLPLCIGWRAEDEEGNVVDLIDEIIGVEIVTSIENDETVGNLNLTSRFQFCGLYSN